METGSKEWVLDKVRKLLALAKNAGATDGERENAMRMAHKTLAKYNVSMAEAETAATGDTEERVFHKVDFFGRPWARVAAQAIAKLFFCEYLFVPSSRAGDTTHFFIGRETNAITAASMAEYIVASIKREGKKAQRGSDAGNIYYRSFATAASVAIFRRVEKMIAESTNPKTPTRGSTDGESIDPSKAIVLANHYKTEMTKNREKAESILPPPDKRKTGRSGSRDFDAEGASDGRRYGETVSLDRQLGGPAPDRKRLL